MKKFSIVLLALIVLISVFPMATFADQPDLPEVEVLQEGETTSVPFYATKEGANFNRASLPILSAVVEFSYDGSFVHWKIIPMMPGAKFTGRTNVIRNGLFQGDIYVTGLSGQRRVSRGSVFHLTGTLTQFGYSPSNITKSFSVK